MPHSLLGRVTNADGVIKEERIVAPDLQSAIRFATERAFEMIAVDLAEGKQRSDGSIIIQDEKGQTVHVVRFRDLIDHSGRRSH